MKGWQKVYSSEQSYRADIVKAVLEDHGMNPVTVNKQDSSYNNFGNYEVHVSSEHVLSALKIIENDINFK
ncbi:hypothetical protein E1176_15640 [Fulvivirga sp. RKSG066]|uniref:putative signal transducing protein n=1 Tax=Fulvivirga aurantia TaxID=2529383 RepID=UPI0012BBA05E|nr:DUF2007 domain-containing protein [Fulvivirga aurantia]MTI22465.1 hypothetical protein [Fulvivirga aurantia]